MNQQTFTDTEYAGRAEIEPYYPRGRRGRPPMGIEKCEEIRKDAYLSKVEYKIAKRPSGLKSKIGNGGTDWDREIERRKASVRSKIEWPHLVIKRQLGYCKAAYKGLKKNINRLFVLFASVNLLKVLQGGRSAEFRAASL